MNGQRAEVGAGDGLPIGVAHDERLLKLADRPRAGKAAGHNCYHIARSSAVRKATYPLALRAVDFTVSTKPPTQGMIAATDPVDGGRDGMAFTPDQEFLLRLNPEPPRLM